MQTLIHTRRWLIEGVCGTGKSSLLAALHALFSAEERSFELA